MYQQGWKEFLESRAGRRRRNDSGGLAERREDILEFVMGQIEERFALGEDWGEIGRDCILRQNEMGL